MSKTEEAPISYGKGRGLIIMVGQKLGYEVHYVNEAIILIKEYMPNAVMLGHVDAEASRIIALVDKDNRLKEANKMVPIVKEEISQLSKCDYCKSYHNKERVSPMLSNGYHVCDACKKKYGWVSVETMAEADEKRRMREAV